MDNQSVKKPKKRRWSGLVLALTAALGLGTVLHFLDLPHVEVQRKDGCLQITIGNPPRQAPAETEIQHSGNPAPKETETQTLSCMDITVTSIPEKARIFFGLPAGLHVLRVEENSDAGKKGIRRGDIITGFNGKIVNTPEELVALYDICPTGSAELTVFRENSYVSFHIPLVKPKTF